MWLLLLIVLILSGVLGEFSSLFELGSGADEI